MHLVKELWPRGRGAHGARDPCHEGTRKTRTPRGAAPTTAGPGHVARRRGSLLKQKGRAGGREDLLSEGTRRQVTVWAEGTQARPTEVTSERASLWGQTSFSLRRPRPRNTLVLPRHTPLGDESGQGPCARRKAGPAASWEIARPCGRSPAPVRLRVRLRVRLSGRRRNGVSQGGDDGHRAHPTGLRHDGAPRAAGAAEG